MMHLLSNLKPGQERLVTSHAFRQNKYLASLPPHCPQLRTLSHQVLLVHLLTLYLPSFSIANPNAACKACPYTSH